jgi:hypothetical protein
MAAPQALTPEQIQQIIAAGRGNTVNIGGTLYGGQWADIGDGESRQEGALQSIYGSTGIDQAGQPFYSYDPSGAYTGQGVTKESKSFFGGLADAFRDPVVLAALGGAGYAGLLGGGAAGAAGLTASELAAADMALGGVGGTLGAEALASAATAGAGASALSSLTPTQIANLARAGINVAGLLGATNAITNMGGGGNTSTATPVTYSGGGAGGYSPEYFSQLQSNYNSLMPNVPRDVASPLQNWYSTEFNPGASVTGSLFGDMVGGMSPNTGVKPVTPPVVKPPVVPPVVKPPVVPPTTVIANSPLYTSLTKTSTPVDVAKAYTDFIAKAGGNTAANRQAATDYLTKLGLTQGQIESSYSAYLNTLPAAGNTYQQLNAKANVDNVVQSYRTFIANAGGDTATNRELATNYLKDIGVPDTLINQAYSTYLSSTTPVNTTGGGGGGSSVVDYGGGGGGGSAVSVNTGGGGGGMMSGGGAANTTSTAAAPSYTTLGASSSPQAIAAAYSDFVANSGGDTAANQQAAVEYLTNLGIGQNTINSAYGLFTGS